MQVMSHKGRGTQLAAITGPDLQLAGQEPPDVEQQYSTTLAEAQVLDYDSTLPAAYNRWAAGTRQL